MCGIIGSFKSEKHFSLGNIMHRGMDHQKRVSFGDYQIGHARLSIIGLGEGANQPYESGNTVLAFNGEIYNFVELGLTQLKKHYTSDTVLLSDLLRKKGIKKTLPLLDGMFSFFWYDGKKGWLVRDRYGKIPLFWSRQDGVIFSSEQKGYGEFMDEFKPGQLYCFEDNSLKPWYNPDVPNYEMFSLQMLEDAVRKRLIADVPVCCLISGGLDSALILTIAKKFKPDIEAFTAVFDPDSKDRLFANKLCQQLGVKLHEVIIAPPKVTDIKDTIYTIETNMKAQVEISLLNLPLAKAISAKGFRVCLSGEGADEVFGGYGNFCIQSSKADEVKWRKLKHEQIYKMSRGNFLRTNLVFMRHGIECRLPFIDKRIIEFGLNAPKEANPAGKKALKEVARGIIPDEIIDRPKDTFQGGAGMTEWVADAFEKIYHIEETPTVYYNRIYKQIFDRDLFALIF